MVQEPDRTVASEQILAALPDCVVVVSPAGVITRNNPAAVDMFAHGEDTLVGRVAAGVLGVLAQGAPLPGEREVYFEPLKRWFEVRHIPAGEGVIVLCRDITSRRVAEQALRYSEQHYRRLVESAEEGFWLLDAQGRTAFVNQRMARMLGYAPEDMTGRHLFEFMDEHVRPIAGEKLAQRRQGTREQHEFEFVRRDGSRIWTLICAGPLYDEQEQYIGALACVTDISQRRATEDKLKDSQRRYQLLSDFIPQIVWVSDGQGHNLHCNQRCVDYSGLSREQLAGDGWLSCVHPEDRARVQQSLRDAWDLGQPYETELRLLRQSDGMYRWHLDQSAPVKDEAGRIVYWLGTSTDIHDRKTMEERLRASEARYRLLTDLLPHTVWTTDATGQVTYCNASAERYTGLTCEHLTGEAWLSMVHPDDVAPLRANLANWSQRREPYEAEHRLRRACDGTYRWHLQRAAPILDANGEVVEWIGTGTDIEDLKQVENEIRRARDQAEEAVLVKNRFLAMISHELRTPLASILLWAKLLRNSSLPEGQRDNALRVIIQCATDQSRLVSDLVDVARGEHGRLVVNPQPLDFRNVVQSVVDRMAPDFAAKPVTLVCELASAQVRGDESRLQQLVSNLLCNALEFTPAGGRVQVLLRRSAREGLLEIRDTGEGIAPDRLPRVFEMFWQADDSNARRHTGLGLGLNIVRRIAEAHGGSVSAASAGVGQGCTFTVALPLVEEDSA